MSIFRFIRVISLICAAIFLAVLGVSMVVHEIREFPEHEAWQANARIEERYAGPYIKALLGYYSVHHTYLPLVNYRAMGLSADTTVCPVLNPLLAPICRDAGTQGIELSFHQYTRDGQRTTQMYAVRLIGDHVGAIDLISGQVLSDQESYQSRQFVDLLASESAASRPVVYPARYMLNWIK